MLASCERCSCPVIITDELDGQPPNVLCNCCRNQADSVTFLAFCVICAGIALIIVGGEKVIGLIFSELSKFF